MLAMEMPQVRTPIRGCAATYVTCVYVYACVCMHVCVCVCVCVCVFVCVFAT